MLMWEVCDGKPPQNKWVMFLELTSLQFLSHYSLLMTHYWPVTCALLLFPFFPCQNASSFQVGWKCKKGKKIIDRSLGPVWQYPLFYMTWCKWMGSLPSTGDECGNPGRRRLFSYVVATLDDWLFPWGGHASQWCNTKKEQMGKQSEIVKYEGINPYCTMAFFSTLERWTLICCCCYSKQSKLVVKGNSKWFELLTEELFMFWLLWLSNCKREGISAAPPLATINLLLVPKTGH